MGAVSICSGAPDLVNGQGLASADRGFAKVPGLHHLDPADPAFGTRLVADT